MNQPAPQSVDAAAVLPHLQQQIGDLSLRLAAATALGEQRHALAVGQANRIAELEEQLRSATAESADERPESDD